MTEVIPTGAVHPVAELFPMLPDDELQELADDIRVNGLQHPIVLDKDGVLIDGRNRWAACQIASVEPRFETLNGQDPVAYIISSNIARRHLSKGQRAMAVVMARSETEQSLRDAANVSGVKLNRLAEANTIRQHAADLVAWVISGAMSLDDAYAEARERKTQAADQESQLAKAKEQLTMLRASAPDLAELVESEQMSLREAMAAWRERERERQEQRERTVTYFENATTLLWSLLRTDPESLAEEWIDGRLKKMTVEGLDHLQTGDGLRDLAERLEQLAIAVDRRGGLS